MTSPTPFSADRGGGANRGRCDGRIVGDPTGRPLIVATSAQWLLKRSLTSALERSATREVLTPTGSKV